MGRFIIESPSDVGRNENKQGRERRRLSVDFESRASKGGLCGNDVKVEVG